MRLDSSIVHYLRAASSRIRKQRGEACSLQAVPEQHRDSLAAENHLPALSGPNGGRSYAHRQSKQCPHCRGSVLMPSSANTSQQVVVEPPRPSVTLRCPHCQSVQVFDGSLAGQVTNCSSCRLALQIPIPQGELMPSVRPEVEPPPKRQTGEWEFNDAEEDDYEPKSSRRRGRGGIAAIRATEPPGWFWE